MLKIKENTQNRPLCSLGMIKAVVLLLSILAVVLLCLHSGGQYKSHTYVRLNGQDIAIYEDGEQNYLFLPSYADTESLKLSGKAEELNPQILQSANCPAIFIETLSGNMDEVYVDKNHREPGKIFAYDEEGNLTYSGGMDYIKGRGNYTWATQEWTKKPFSIGIDEKVELLGQPAGGKFALFANASDSTLIRNDLARQIQTALGMEKAKRGTFTDLYINGEYMGLYYLCTTPGARLEKYEVELNNATGGYLIEREMKDRFLLDPDCWSKGFVTDTEEYFTIHTPKHVTPEQIAYIKNYLDLTENAILSSRDSADMKTVDTDVYKKYVDQTSFVQTYLTEEIIKNFDAGITSAYYYKDSDDRSGKLFCAPGWDYDMSLGSYLEWMHYEDPAELTRLYIHPDPSEWFNTMYDQPDFYKETVDLYRENRQDIYSILCASVPQQMQELYSASYQMEYLRWKEMYDARGIRPGSEEAYKELLDFTEKRLEFLDSVWITE